MVTAGERTDADRFRVVAAVEATTLLVLVGTAVWRAAADGPDLSALLGPVHGMAFVAYVIMALRCRTERSWSAWRTVAIVVLAVVPGAGYVVAARLADASA